MLKDLIKLDDLALPGAEQVIHIGGLSDQELEVDAEQEVAWEAVLHPAVDAQGHPSRRVADMILARWGEWLAHLEGEIHARYVHQVGPLTYMPVRLRRSALEQAARFNPLRLLRPAPRLRGGPLRGARHVAATAQVPQATTPASDERIAVFDGGVDTDHPLLKPFVREHSLTPAARTDNWVSHGTLVTSAALYGHLPVGAAPPRPPAYVDHYRVLPAPSNVPPEDEPYWFLEQIQPVLESGDHRVISLSYGPEVTVDEDEVPDVFTATIDELAFEHDLSVYNAVGNNGLPILSPLGADRVMAPADAVNAVGVGACDDPHPAANVRRADYSCVGPGRHGLALQPVGLAFGGTGEVGFSGAEPGGGMQVDHGTSYATPSVARAAATLTAQALASDAVVDASLRRAMLIHYAAQLSRNDLEQRGHGLLPADLRPLLNCPTNVATVVVHDRIPRGETFAYPLPYPTTGLTGNMLLRRTVSFLSPTDPTDPFDYTLAGLKCFFRPNICAYRWTSPDKSETQVYDTRVHATQIAAIEAEKWTKSANPVTHGTSGAVRSQFTERERAHWETVRHYQLGIRGSSLHQPEIWLQCFERDRGQLVPKAQGSSLDFAVLMTVQGAREQLPVYDAVKNDARFGVLTSILAPAAVQVPASGARPASS